MRQKDIVPGELYAWRESKYDAMSCARAVSWGPADFLVWEEYRYYEKSGRRWAIEFVDPESGDTYKHEMRKKSGGTSTSVSFRMPWAEWTERERVVSERDRERRAEAEIADRNVDRLQVALADRGISVHAWEARGGVMLQVGNAEVEKLIELAETAP